MYSWEIKDYISKRNNKLTRDEFYEVVNSIKNPQVSYVQRIRDNRFSIITSDNWGFEVEVIK